MEPTGEGEGILDTSELVGVCVRLVIPPCSSSTASWVLRASDWTTWPRLAGRRHDDLVRQNGDVAVRGRHGHSSGPGRSWHRITRYGVESESAASLCAMSSGTTSAGSILPNPHSAATPKCGRYRCATSIRRLAPSPPSS